eukprot:CAMPEP_0117493936 /NCGR_PEP_ID=MMETSP0784-20121206/19353_1 /TAXON_ID=39447 /ORGANISM="" /LENGTH=155 /DNA_ID=CAMNT_0005288801 /DNA_START=973 /DNA_END=1435 /DNA_ORIENTATION=+
MPLETKDLTVGLTPLVIALKHPMRRPGVLGLQALRIAEPTHLWPQAMHHRLAVSVNSCTHARFKRQHAAQRHTSTAKHLAAVKPQVTASGGAGAAAAMPVAGVQLAAVPVAAFAKYCRFCDSPAAPQRTPRRRGARRTTSRTKANRDKKHNGGML